MNDNNNGSNGNKYAPRFPEPEGFGVLEDYRDMAWNCVNCNYCHEMWSWDMKSGNYTFTCPSFANKRLFAYAGHGRSQIIRALLEGDFGFEDSKMLLDIAFYCQECGACEMNCLRLQERHPARMIEALRAELIERGMVLPEHKAFLESTVKYGNPFDVPKKNRTKWTEGLGFGIKKLPKEQAEVLLYVGCMYSLETRIENRTTVFGKILSAAGVDFGILGADEKCCGMKQLNIGERGLFEALAEENIESINRLGIKTLVTPCPHCYYSFRSYYPKVGKLNCEVLHFTQYVERLVKGGRITFKEMPRQTVTYSDPCNLGRYAGVYDAPREILKSIKGIELREMERSHDQAFCCGAGGGVMTAYPEFSAWTAEERVKEAESTGAQTVAAACPWCEYNLDTGIENRAAKLQLYDVSEIVYNSMKEGKHE